MTAAGNNKKCVSYNKWGYIFLLPFAIAYLIFQFYPMLTTVYNSFFENYMGNGGLKQVGPNWVGLENYATLFKTGHIMQYLKNTMIMWVMGFVPQILLSLLLASWFSNMRMRIRGVGFFKAVIYLPNLIMASAFSMLFFSLFSDIGPINSLLIKLGVLDTGFRFFSNVWATRIIIAFMNFLMWFGNTTILLMAGIMGIDPSLMEAAEVDGAKPRQSFMHITLPLLKPILTYVMITSLLGGIQMFDVPQILTRGAGSPAGSTTTLIMSLNSHLYSKNYGMAGALSVILLFITGVLSMFVYRSMVRKTE